VTIQPSLDRIVLVLYHIIPILTTTHFGYPPTPDGGMADLAKTRARGEIEPRWRIRSVSQLISCGYRVREGKATHLLFYWRLSILTMGLSLLWGEMQKKEDPSYGRDSSRPSFPGRAVNRA
jgi:hypothetical protein